MTAKIYNDSSIRKYFASGLSLAFLFVICLSVFGTGCSKLGSVEGTVVDYLTGKPLAGVKVSIGGTTLSAVTDAQGRYLLEGVIPGNQKLEAQKDGYLQVGNVDIVIGARTKAQAKAIQMLRVPPSDGLFVFDETTNTYLRFSRVSETDVTMGGATLIKDKNRTRNLVIGTKQPLVARWPQTTSEVIVQKLKFIPKGTTTIFFTTIRSPDRWVTKESVAVKTTRIDDTTWLISLDGLPNGDYLLNPKGAPGVYDIKLFAQTLPEDVAIFFLKQVSKAYSPMITSAYVRLASGLILAGKMKAARTIIDFLVSRYRGRGDTLPSALADIAVAYAKAGRKKDAMLTVKLIEKTRFYDSAIGDIATELVKAGEIEEGLRLVDSIKNKNCRLFVKGRIFVMLMEEGKKEKALEVGNSVDPEMWPGWIGDVVTYFFGEGCREKDQVLVDVLNYALNKVRKLDSPSAKAKLLFLIASGLARAGKLDRPEKLFAEFLEAKKNIKTPQEQEEIDEGLPLFLAMLGKTEQALKIVNSIESLGRRLELLCSICKLQAVLGDSKSALETSKLISDQESRDRCLHEMVKPLLKQGNYKDALIIAGNIVREDFKREDLVNSAVAEAKDGDIAVALEILNSVKKVEDKFLIEISSAMAKRGKIGSAINIAKKILDPNLRKYSFSLICIQLVKRPREEGEKFAGQVLREGLIM